MSAAAETLPGLHWHPQGYAGLSGPLLKLADELDQRFLSCGDRGPLEAHHAPSFVSLADLAPVGYVGSFPHLATFAATLGREGSALRAFAAAQDGCGATMGSADWEPVRQLLTPAACYHLYPRLRGRTLAGPKYLTIRAHCHRHESSYAPLERQWCFQMRELVCVGPADAVEAFAESSRRRVEDLSRTLGIRAEWRVATDPFFDPDHDPKAIAQRVQPVKLELTLPGGIAISSVNRHRAFFGERYGIVSDGDAAHSACVAFGIERWLLAVVRARGTDPAHWCLADGSIQ